MKQPDPFPGAAGGGGSSRRTICMGHLRRPLLGALIGAASACLFGIFYQGAMVLVCMPGALALGALLGWCGGRLRSRGRLPAMLALGLACAVGNAPVSGVINFALGDPMRLHEHDLSGHVAVGLIGVYVLWWMVLPIGLVAGALLTRGRARRP